MVNKIARISFWSILIIFSLVGVLLLGIVLADHEVTNQETGGTSFSVNQSASTLYNITINNTDDGQDANITQVNITIPDTFSFIAGTIGTDALNETFTNTTTILNWTNSTAYLINGSKWKYFWFNASAATPGDYNITVTTVNTTGSYDSNISVEVNDTVNPIASLGTNPIDNYVNNSSTIVFDLKCNDNYDMGTLQLYGNWSGGWHANETNSTPINDTYWNVSVSGIADGNYTWGAYCNDSAGNYNWSVNRTLIVDTTPPSVTITSPTTTTYNTPSILFNITATDTTTSVDSCWYSLDAGATNQTLTQDGSTNYYNYTNSSVPDGGSYTAHFWCNDSVGNLNDTESAVFTVVNGIVSECKILNTANTTYTLNQSIDSGTDGDCIIISNESIILDCAGYNITFGNSSGGIGIINMDGITTVGYTNVTIKNCNIYENLTNSINATAIFFGVNSSSATIFNNTITTQGEETGGMLFNTNLTNSNISSNTLTISGNSGIGMTVINGSDTSINSNTFTVSGNDGVGIAIMDGSSIGMDSNDITISGNLSGGIYFMEGVTDSNITSNNINLSVSNPENTTSILLFGGSNSNLLYNNTITTSGGGIIIENSTSTNFSSNTIISLSSASDSNAVFLEGANSSVVENNNITTALMGIYVQGSPNTNISSNNITSSGTEDDDTSMIRLEDSDSSIVDYNIITASNERASGIAMEDVNNVLVNLNTITTSGEGASGICLTISDSTNITSNNIITNNTNSAGIFSTFSNSTLIFNNTITTTGNSSNGIYIFNLFNTIANNTLNTTNGYAIYVDGLTVTYYNHTIENNTEQGQNILYFFNNDSGIVEDQTLGQLIVTNSTNVTVDNVTVNYDGLTFIFTNGSLINNSNFTTTANNIHGIDFFDSSYNNVTNCRVKTLTGNESCIISFYSNSSNYNIFYNNIFNVSVENSLSDSGAGVCWGDSSPVNNTWNTTYSASVTNILGHGIGGNFWTNSLGTGYSDNCTDADGGYICDDQYGIIDYNIDYLPLADHTNAAFECATLNTENETYYLNQSISSNGTCFNITANNITLNFNGFNITGNTTGYGINITTHNDTTVLNGTISNFSNGIYISSSSSNSFTSINIINSTTDAILLEGNTSDNNNFTSINTTNTTSSHYDINFSTAGIDGTWIEGINFANYSFEGVGGKVNFKEPSFGEIVFLEAINGSGTDLSSDVDVDEEWVFVNSSNNAGVNKSANISFYSVSFTNPKPQYSSDNSVWADCTASTNPACVEFSYTIGGTFTFNVSHFTYFKIVEGYSAPEDDDTSSSSGGGDINYYPSLEQLSDGYTRNLFRNYKIYFEVKRIQHLLNVDSITSSGATITISSTPQTKTLAIGEEWKVELTGDNFYDLFVTLNSITGNTASLTIKSVSEEIKSIDVHKEGEKTEEEITPEVSYSKNIFWEIILIILIILAVVLVVVSVKKKKKIKR